MLAVILGAAMSSISSEMNSLATVSVIDIYKRHVRKDAPDRHYLMASRAATLFWGCYAVASAQYVKRIGSLVEAVNLLGSFFYGGMLGVFVLAFFFPQRTGAAAPSGACCAARPPSSPAGTSPGWPSSGTTWPAAWWWWAWEF